MRVLGIDPGSRTTGWGLIGGTAARPRMLDCGVISLGGSPMAKRLAVLQAELVALLERLVPSTAAVESPFHGANARSALQLAHARGVILAGLAAAGVEVVEYTPATVKKSVAGTGRAPKDQVQRMIGRLLGAGATGVALDATDALAVALCHATSGRFAAAVDRANAAGAASTAARRAAPGARRPVVRGVRG